MYLDQLEVQALSDTIQQMVVEHILVSKEAMDPVAEMDHQDPMVKMHRGQVKVEVMVVMAVVVEMENPVKMVKMLPASVEMVGMVGMERRVVTVLMAETVGMDIPETVLEMEPMVKEDPMDPICSLP